MLRDLPLEFTHAFRYTDAQDIIEKTGVFYNKQVALVQENSELSTENTAHSKRHVKPTVPKFFNEGGIFLIIVEQNTETNMKGVDFIGHAIRKFPNLSESDFVLLTHRLELVPPKNYVFPVIEKPLRAPQIRQIVLQRMKYAQDIVAMQSRAEGEATLTLGEKTHADEPSKKRGLREFLKINRKTEEELQPTEENIEGTPKASQKKKIKKAKQNLPKKKNSNPKPKPKKAKKKT
ncbi:MAG: hypothetical protein LDLANPLL_01189 [Turneriella sp.]|nr:hypothetical protein [Turneriella sp.]